MKATPPPRPGFFRRQFSLQGLRRALIGLVVFLTLIGLLVTEENWRGKHDWDTYRHQQEAKGEKFDWQAFVPPAVPADQNLFTAPVFTNLLAGKIKMNPYPKSDKTYNYGFGNWQKSSLTDLKPWQKAYRDLREDDNGMAFPVSPQPSTPAADVLFALSRYDDTVEKLREASRLPDANIPLPYQDGISAVAETLLPYLATLKQCAQVLNVRAIAELANNQNQTALDDIRLSFYLNDSLNNTPLLISQLVRMAIMNIEMQSIWEGLAEHKWSEEQLVALDAELAREDFLADYETAMRGERTCAISTYEMMRRNGEIFIQGENGNSETVKLSWMPNAFYYQNEFAFARLYQQWLFPLVDTHSHTISPEIWRQMDTAAHAAQKHFFPPYTIMARMTVPALDATVKRFAFAQSVIDLARVACALERYRLTHGQYPDSLADLEPQFIAKVPHDIINGQPLHYGLKPDDRFILYSVGWNETDDGGQVVLTKPGGVDRDQGDWVWQYPQK
jgi:hypothetical protein